MHIGELAIDLDVDTHVLRHWESAGLLHPRRQANGYRDYDSEQVTRARIILRCREAGLSLPVIGSLLDRHAQDRATTIQREIAELDQQVARLHQTRSFLDHVAGCRHSLMERCPGCSRYSSGFTQRGD